MEGTAWADAVSEIPDRMGQILQAIPLSELHKGYCPGDLITLCARPGTGKSAVMCQAMWEAGLGFDESCFLFSGDMSPAEIANWMGRAHHEAQRLTREQWDKTLDLLRGSKLAIKHSGVIDTTRVRAVLEARPETRYVFIDHFNKISTGSQTRVVDLKRAAADIKDMAGQYGVTMFVLSQINREGEGSQHLTRANVAESDALVQESDVIYGLTLVGDAQQQDHHTATVQLSLIKNRHGQDGVSQTAYFHKDQRRFEWLSREIPWGSVL